MSVIQSALADALRDRYLLERELGHGGMATVYLARDRKHDRPVALKVLRSELSAALGSERFRREIALVTRLQHPHILPVHDSGVIEAGPATHAIHWYTMPFVTGESLRDRLAREKQLPVDDAVRIAYETARALDHAHRHGVIHRDIKPENLLLTEEGDTLVADFGVGRAVDPGQSGERLTEAGFVVGTPAYMSPEQSAGDQAPDGRTDVYSLGIVLYEMLAGEPPFTGRSPQAIIARRLTETPRPLRLEREAIPLALERIVMRALARAPADRYTAPALADALDGLRRTPEPAITLERTVAVRPPARRVPWRPIAIGAAVAAAAAGGWLLLRRAEPSGPLDTSLVAVAPFDVLDPRLELWREGLVDLLSRNLDGAGPVRSVAPTVVVRRWNGRADHPSAGELGRATGAGLVVYGSVLSAGPDSVKVRATLLDVARARPLDEWELADQTDRIDRITDSLTWRVLRSLGRTQPLGAVRLAGLGSTSLPALKAFLQGEQFLRRTEFDSALGQYQRAIELDSTFPLALRRASAALGWIRTGSDSLSTAYALRAGDHNRGLPIRDSLLVCADSLMASLLASGVIARQADSAWSSRLDRLFATLERATARYPADPEVWFLTGEATHHLGPYRGATFEEQIEAFDRAIALDSAFAPSYIHPIELSMGGGRAEVTRYLRPYLTLDPHDTYADALRLVGRLLDSASGRTGPSGTDYTAMSDHGLFAMINALARLPDSAEVILELSRFFGSRARSLPMSDQAFNGKRILARSLLSRGHFREAYGVLEGRFVPHLVDAVLLAGQSAESTAAVLRRQLPGMNTFDATLVLPLWAVRGDTLSLRATSAQGDSAARKGATDGDRARGRYAAAAAAAYLTLVHGDTAGAIQRLADLRRADCPACYLDRLVLARLLVDTGRDREAWDLLRAAPITAVASPFPSEVLWTLLRARVAERRGDRERAVRDYGWVAGMWRHADRELRPYADEARAALARLTAEER